MNNKLNVFSSSKVANEKDKVTAYLNGEKIFPTTIELDLTQLCSRACPGCPYLSSRKPGLTLQLPFLDRLFGILGPETPGIVLSGGEPTIVPHFPDTVAMAKKKGFQEIAVISNGGMTHLPKIQDALLENVTSIRFSLYDWQETEGKYFYDLLEKIRNLRNRIEREGSKLEIGASILTRSKLNHRYQSVGMQAIDAGIHWLYFHPYCVDWDTDHPIKDDQTDVLKTLEYLKLNAPENANIQIPTERYSMEPLYFEKLHGSHFLIQVGADGINYAGPECKYHKEAALLDLNEYMEDDFLWHPQRIERINQLNNGNYRYIGTKHRPPMFSHYIQKLIDNQTKHYKLKDEQIQKFSYPNII
ncbi:MAG: hypothetical protein CVU00_08805 [Bacteroidetes bacterium HGW-Bacteroidetes-17]|jgi:MoaA/NifB/PqqE/SkfB family radical SAM enzyme|nr:MAG: hypothetical protein CVU00_08805 [Bacteroidetes bacterium HGW-Bacteroidetes-17]